MKMNVTFIIHLSIDCRERLTLFKYNYPCVMGIIDPSKSENCPCDRSPQTASCPNNFSYVSGGSYV